MIENIRWIGHASFYIDISPRIYIDPWRVPSGMPPADVILLTHEHYDHFSLPDIERIATPDTTIIANQMVSEGLAGDFETVTLRPWQSINIQSVNIKTVPAHTHDDYHPATREDLGFVIAANHYDIYYAGDTDFVPDLRQLRCDIAILPVSAKEGTMTVDEAVDFVKSLKPQYVVPSHYGTAEGGNLLDAKALETALDGIAEVVLMETSV